MINNDESKVQYFLERASIPKELWNDETDEGYLLFIGTVKKAFDKMTTELWNKMIRQHAVNSNFWIHMEDELLVNGDEDREYSICLYLGELGDKR